MGKMQLIIPVIFRCICSIPFCRFPVHLLFFSDCKLLRWGTASFSVSHLGNGCNNINKINLCYGTQAARRDTSCEGLSGKVASSSPWGSQATLEMPRSLLCSHYSCTLHCLSLPPPLSFHSLLFFPQKSSHFPSSSLWYKGLPLVLCPLKIYSLCKAHQPQLPLYNFHNPKKSKIRYPCTDM